MEGLDIFVDIFVMIVDMKGQWWEEVGSGGDQ